ncbi:hypothetical protein FGB62_85g15 [Gracilaria domingensis]|nr:hypothetical protein FGB62_85g15 [Gracilaria domingensis]
MPPRVRLSFKQKQDIRNEHNRRTVEGLRTDQHDLAEWAKKTFKISKAPGQATISRILKEENQDNASSARYRNRTGAYPEFEKALLEWILAQFSSRIAINGPMIIEAEEIVGFVNQLVPSRAHGRISIESLLNGEEEDRECVSTPGIDEIVSNALQSIAEEDTDEQDEDEDISFIEELSVDDQLAYIAVALLILENQDRARGAGAAELRSAQRDLRRERASSMQQTRISSFFAHE